MAADDNVQMQATTRGEYVQMHAVKIELIEGKQAPKYDTGQEIEVQAFVITEQGTQANLPIVDIVMRGKDGAQYVAVISGRLLLGVAAAIRGANKRNHGVEEP